MKPNIPWDAKIDYSKSMLKDMPQGFITIPKGATNGDMIKKMFPQAKAFNEDTSCATIKIDMGSHDEYVDFYIDWWNTPYKISEVEE